MAPKLAPSKDELIYDMIHNGELSLSEMVQVAGCNRSTIRRIFASTRIFGSVKASPNKGGRPWSLTLVMLEALCDRLLEKPTLYLDEMAIFLWNEFTLLATKLSISRALRSKGRSKKTARVKAREGNLELRDEYSHYMSDFQSYHLIYVDESGCDKRIGFRRTGRSPLGMAPIQVSRLHRDQRYQILPAYAQDGIALFRVFQGPTNAAVF